MSKTTVSRDQKGNATQKTVTTDDGRHSTNYKTYTDGFAVKKTSEVVNKPNGTTVRK